MARNIFTVNATQVNAQGQYSVVSGFPKNFDSESYSGSTETALRRAKSAFYAQCSANYAVDGKQMQTVTLYQANGQVIMKDSEGNFVEPEPNPEPEEEAEE